MTSTFVAYNSSGYTITSSNNYASTSNLNCQYTYKVVWTGTKWFDSQYRTSTDGVTWTAVNRTTFPLATFSTRAYTVSIVGGQVHLLTDAFKYYVSTDGGSTWTYKCTPSNTNSNGVGVAKNTGRDMRIESNLDGSIILLHCQGAQFAISTDGGSTWTYRYNTAFIQPSFYFVFGTKIYHSNGGNGYTFDVSTNMGVTWSKCTDAQGGTNPSNQITSAYQAMAMSSDTNAVCAGTFGNYCVGYVCRYTTDGGAHWYSGSGFNGTAGMIMSVVWNSSLYYALVLSQDGNSVGFYSSPTGATWTLLNTVTTSSLSGSNVSLLTVNYIYSPLSTQIANKRTTYATIASTQDTAKTTAKSSIQSVYTAKVTMQSTASSATTTQLQTTATNYQTEKASLTSTYVTLAAQLKADKDNLNEIITLLS